MTLSSQVEDFDNPFDSTSGPDPLYIRIHTWNLRGTALPRLSATSHASAVDLGVAFDRAVSTNITSRETLREGYIWLDDLPIPDQKELSPMLLHEKQSQHDLENVSFDFRTRDNIIVSARRSKYNSKTTPLKSSQKRRENSAIIVEALSDHIGSESDLASSEENDGYAAEDTCSEGSTELDSAEESPVDGTDEDEEPSSGDDDASADSADEYSSEDSYNSSSSDEEDGYPNINQSAGRRHRKDTVSSSMNKGNLTFDKEGQAVRTRERPKRRLSERTNMIKASLSVYEIRSGHPVRLFHFQQDLPVILYSSPPALHPSKSLVAWPLGGGDVLFADYMANTYFIRGAVPNTQDSECFDFFRTLILSNSSTAQVISSLGHI